MKTMMTSATSTNGRTPITRQRPTVLASQRSQKRMLLLAFLEAKVTGKLRRLQLLLSQSHLMLTLYSQGLWQTSVLEPKSQNLTPLLRPTSAIPLETVLKKKYQNPMRHPIDAILELHKRLKYLSRNISRLRPQSSLTPTVK